MSAQLQPRQGALPAVEPQSDSVALMHVIERAALDPQMDVAKLEKLLELKERWDAKQAKLAFDAAMARAQAQIQPVVADAENTQTGSKYAKLKSIVASLSPIYTAEGFSVSFGQGACDSEKLREAGWFRTLGYLTHQSGHRETFYVDLPLDVVGSQGKVNKTQIHGAKSSISYARVILMGMMFNFTTSLDVDDDGNAAGARREPDAEATDEQLAKIQEYRESDEIPDVTLKWLDKQESLTEKQAAALLKKLAKVDK